MAFFMHTRQKQEKRPPRNCFKICSHMTLEGSILVRSITEKRQIVFGINPILF
jgi:hypothetical protein